MYHNIVQIFLPETNKKNIAGKNALVTGGANGLGREICLKLADEGCNIAVIDLDLANAERTAKSIRVEFGVQAQGYKMDVTDVRSIEFLKQKIEDDFGGPIEILVNNAGIIDPLIMSEANLMDIKQVIDVNLFSVICVS